MSLLNQIETTARMQPRRVLLYGPRGIGLSSFAAALAEPVFVACDDSLGHLDCHRFLPAGRFGDVLRALKELHVEPHGYRTVVVDPLDSLERLILDAVRREHGIEHVAAQPFARGHALALACWQEVLDALDALRTDIGMTCVLIARAQAERVADPASSSAPLIIERQAPALHHRASALVQSWCDEVLCAACDEPNTNAAPGRAVQAGGRVLLTTPSKTHAVKNRLGLPPRMPMDARLLARHLAVPRLAQAALN